MTQVGDLLPFQLFVRALAARSGQLLNLSGLAGELGIADNTAKRWLSVLETAVIGELLKAALHRGETARLHFWRTATGVEVDVLAQQWESGAERLTPLEVKTPATTTARMARGIRGLQADLGGMVAPGYVVYMGDRRLPLGDDVTSLPLSES